MRAGPMAFGNLFHGSECAGLRRELQYYALWSSQNRVVTCVDFRLLTGVREGVQRVDEPGVENNVAMLSGKCMPNEHWIAHFLH